MARRSQDWEEGLSADLRDSIDERKEFFLALLDEGYEWRDALNKIVRIIGVNEYAELVGDIKPSNLLNQLKPGGNMTLNTLEKITKPLGIKITFTDRMDEAG